MSSLVSKIFAAAAFIGVSANVLPETSPWILLLPITSAALLVWNRGESDGRILRGIASLTIVTSVLFLWLSAPMGAALASALCLVREKNTRKFAVLILLLQTSIVSTIEAILAGYLFAIHAEASSSALIALFAMLLITRRQIWFWCSVMAVTLALPMLIATYVLSPLALQVYSAIPSLLYILFLCSRAVEEPPSNQTTFRLIIVCLIVGLISYWLASPPKTIEQKYVYFKESSSAPESTYYKSYQSSLDYARLGFKQVDSLDSIPKQSLVLLPWLTVPLVEDNDISLSEIRDKAIEGGWTVILVGEHDNMGQVAERINKLIGREAINNDLTVPPGNLDSSGLLRTGGLLGWPPSTIYNRGASVNVSNMFDRVLLSGDGWWSEENINEWLWIGDFLWQPNNRSGRLSLVASYDVSSARWIVVGDSTPFLNNQIVSSATAVQMLIELSSLWPVFLRDLLLSTVALICLLANYITIVRISIIAIAVSLCSEVSFSDHRSNSATHNPDFSSFDERNFNNRLVENPALMDSKWVLTRSDMPLVGKIALPVAPTVMFAHVEKDLVVGGAKLTMCRRLGNIKTDDGPYLMDAQSCSVSGNAKVLIGDNDGAAAIAIDGNDDPLILILDTSFLGQKAPPENAKWLIKTLNLNWVEN